MSYLMSFVENTTCLSYISAHAPGLVTLQVACEGFVISNSVVFEYKAKRAMSLPEPQPSVTENQLRVALVQRLEAIEKRLGQSDTGSIQQVIRKNYCVRLVVVAHPFPNQ